MKILTLLPPTFAVDNRPDGRNGSNMFLYAMYWRGHPRSPAIAMHEVHEARRSLPLSLLAVAVGASAMHFLGLPAFGPLDLPTTIIADLIGAMLVLLVYMMLPGRKKATNLAGEAVECVVEAKLYPDGRSYEAALALYALEGARQMHRGYGVGVSVADALEQLSDRLDAAEAWVERNPKLLAKAQRLQL